MTYDGLVSRYLNRPLSRPVARGLRPTPLTPNQVTTFTLLLAVATGAMIAAGWNIAGGIAIQAVSVIDGVDGELARLKDRATRFGGVFDAVSDRYADAIMLAGMTVYAVRFEDYPRPEFVGALALGAALIVSYSRARIEADLPDVAAIGTVLGQCYWTLIILAAVSGLTIAWRLLYLRITVGGRRLPPA